MGAFENFDEIVDTIFDEEILFAPSFSFDFIGEIILLLNLEEFSVSWLFFSIFSNLFELIYSDDENDSNSLLRDSFFKFWIFVLISEDKFE